MCKEKVACSCSSLERMKDGDYFPDFWNTSMPAQCSYHVRLQLRCYKGMSWKPFAEMVMFQSQVKKVLQQFIEGWNILSHLITHHPFPRVSSQLAHTSQLFLFLHLGTHRFSLWSTGNLPLGYLLDEDSSRGWKVSMKLIALGSQKCLGDATKMCLFKVCKIQILHHNLPKIFMRIFSIFQVLQLTHN